MKKYPTVYILIITISGIIVSINLNISRMHLIFLLIIGIYLFISDKTKFNIIGISLLIIAISIFSLNNTQSKFNYNLDNKYYNITGDIKSIKYNNDKTTIILTNVYFDDNSNQKDIMIYLNKIDPDLKVGNSICLSNKIHIPRKNYNPGEFNFYNYLITKNIYSYTYANDVNTIGHTKNNTIKIQAKFHNYLIDTFEKFNEELSQFLYTVFSGNNILSEENNLLFRDLGIIHILSISGFHIVLLDTFIVTILNLFSINKKSRRFISLVIITIYCFLIGFPISAIRALLFLFIDFLTFLFKKPRVPIKTFAITALIILLVNPQAIYSIGFQFSFLATLAIIIVYPIIRSKKYSNKSIINNIYFTISISLLLIPLQIYYFNIFPLGAVISNIVAIPILVAIIQLGVLFIIFDKIKILSIIIASIIRFLYSLVDIVIVGLNKFFSNKILIYLNSKELFLVYVVIILSLVLLQYYQDYSKNIKKFKIIFLKLLPFHIIFTIFILNFNNVVKFSMINIGQGDSFLLESKNNVLLFDTGGSFKNNSKRLINYLKYNNVKKINGIFLSHFDEDHSGNLADILEEYSNTIVLGRKNGKEFLTKKYNLSNLNYIELNEGDTVSFDKVAIKIIYSKTKKLNENDNSMVLKLIIGNRSILLTGDIEETSELALLNQDISSDIIKIPHHGSKTSSNLNFIEKVKPKYGLLSVGENNIYNLPNGEVMERYENSNVSVKRTDFDGFTTVVFNNNSYKIYTYNELALLNVINTTNILYLIYFSYIIIVMKIYIERMNKYEIKK